MCAEQNNVIFLDFILFLQEVGALVPGMGRLPPNSLWLRRFQHAEMVVGFASVDSARSLQ